MNDLYLSAEQTAERLGISLTSVYAYVSRGLIRSQQVKGSKRRVYWRADVEKLKRSQPSAPEPGALPTRLVEKTKITLLTNSGHYYRGKSALELARTYTLEDVAAHLWEAERASIFLDELPRIPKDALRARAPGEAVWQRMMRMLFAIEQADPRAFNMTRDGYCRSGADALRCVAAACLDLKELSNKPIHELICDSFKADSQWYEIVRVYLVLAADHELDPTTYAVRAAANTGVTPYAAIAAGLLSSSGRRRVFGQMGTLGRLFEEVESAADAHEPIIRRLRAGEAIPGFTSSAYPNGDPRATVLLGLLRTALEGDEDFRRLEILISTVSDAIGTSPSVVVPALFLERKLGMRADHTSFLMIARVVGWIAHAIEQYYENELVRPHADYAGILPDAPVTVV